MRSRILFVSGHRMMPAASRACLHSLPIALDHVEPCTGVRQASAERLRCILTEPPCPTEDGGCTTPGRQFQQAPEVIVTDPQSDARFWAEALNLGAYDLLPSRFMSRGPPYLVHACSRVGRPT